MPLTAELLESVTSRPAEQAWGDIAAHLWETFSAPITSTRVDAEVVRRDRSITELENTLSGSCWDMWESFESSIPKNSQSIVDFWNRIHSGKSVLILDGLSLRESPWLLQQAKERGYTIHDAGPRGAELPCETTPFAHALGLGQRSSLENNGAGGAHKLQGAGTESSDLNWQDCTVGNQEGFVFWHHWPDKRMHDLSDPGEGLHKLSREAHDHLTSDDFWAFVERMASGRRLVIAGIIQDKAYFRERVEPFLDGSNITYIGPVDVAGKNELFAQAAVLLHLNTIPERFGLVLVEANAAGVPVVAMDLGSCREVISDGETGLLVSSVKEAVQALEKVSDIDPSTCRQRVQEHFSIDTMVRGYEQVYADIFSRETSKQ